MKITSQKQTKNGTPATKNITRNGKIILTLKGYIFNGRFVSIPAK